MQQHEVTDEDNIRWTCVQAYGGMQENASEKATDLAATKEGEVTVVCTPSGGAQTVRLQLPGNWFGQLTDEELLDALVKTT